MDKTDIQKLFQMNTEELLIITEGDEINFNIGLIENKDNRLHYWFSSNYLVFKDMICSSNKVKIEFTSGKINRIDLCAAIADSLSGYYTGLACFTASVLLIKIGLENICKDFSCDN